MTVRTELVRDIAGTSDRTAEDAFATAPWEELSRASGVDLVAEVAGAVARNSLLSKRAQSKRLASLLRGLRLSPDQLLSLARAAREFPGHLRVTVADALPPAARQEVYGSGEERSPAGARAMPLTPVESAAPTAIADAEPSPDDERPAYATVVLYSHSDHQDGNRKQLTAADLDPILVDTYDDLKSVLASSRDICACVIDQSALVVLDQSAQRELLQTLAGYSSFLAIRLQYGPALLLSHDAVKEIIRSGRQLGTPVSVDSLSLQTDGMIRAAELPFFRNVSKLLQAHVSATFLLGDLSDSEAHLLVAAARARVRSEGLSSQLDKRPLTVRFLSGGRSGARLAIVSCGGTPTFVAKVTSTPLALGELYRYRTLVQPVTDERLPECHFHGESAVILFRLVRGDGDSMAPADPIESRLEALWNAQWMRGDAAQLEEDRRFLGLALKRAAKSLADLNRNAPPPDWDLNAYVNPPATHLDAVESDGLAWGLDESALVARGKAAARVRERPRQAIVHGDIHLRNILIKGETEIHIIDYECAGPGHPAVDLVRLEVALYLGPVRQFQDSDSCVSFQRALSIERTTIKVLRERFPGFFQCHVNDACAVGMVDARDAAIAVLETYGGDPRDYLAAKFLVAWQSLALIGRQSGLARAVISALASHIADWE